MSLAHKWNSKINFREKHSLLNTLKLVATGMQENQKYGTYSGYVKKLSLKNTPSGTMYDPEAYMNNTHTEYHSYLKKFITENTDIALTNKTKSKVNEWGENSVLHHVRTFLGITQNIELPFDIIVVKQSYEELMHGKVGFAAFYTTAPGKPTIVLGSNYEKGMIEHEYAHSQSKGMWRWYQLLLFRGVTEALTESCTTSPTSYAKQRKVIDLIFTKHPEWKKIFYSAYIGNEFARQDLFTQILYKYGFDGFLTLARMAPVDNPSMSGSVGTSIFIKPQKAFDFFAM